MTDKRIDILRKKIHMIGLRQGEYYEFFPKFAYDVCERLSAYLGAPGIVRTTAAYGDFTFDIEYHQEGLDFQDGRFRIPLMIRFDSLHDTGYLAYRLLMFCTKCGDTLSISLNDGPSFSLSVSNLEELYSKIYNHLLDIFSSSSFFAEHKSDYHTTVVGFLGETENA